MMLARNSRPTTARCSPATEPTKTSANDRRSRSVPSAFTRNPSLQQIAANHDVRHGRHLAWWSGSEVRARTWLRDALGSPASKREFGAGMDGSVSSAAGAPRTRVRALALGRSERGIATPSARRCQGCWPDRRPPSTVTGCGAAQPVVHFLQRTSSTGSPAMSLVTQSTSGWPFTPRCRMSRR